MNAWIKYMIIVLLVFVASGAGLVIYKFNIYRPEDIVIEPVPDNLKYFSDSYEQCREGFRTEAKNVFITMGNVQVEQLSVESREDPDLTIDYCYIPAQKKFKRLLIMTSGIHGVEGYAGSAVQQMFIKEILPQTNVEELGILLIHSVNPFGFKYQRRVTENNVDLNRNCSVDISLYDKPNEGYAALNSWLNRKRVLRLTEFDHFFFPLYALQKKIKYSMQKMRQAILQGQYRYEKGIFFGGKSRESSIQKITPLIQQIALPYEMVFCIDLHTGYGANGVLHLLHAPVSDTRKRQRLSSLFKDVQIDWADTRDFYSVTGDFLSYLEQILSDKAYMSMTFEFGTMDTQTTLGAIKALHNVIIENQGFQYGYATKGDETAVRERFLQGYFPSSAAWRSKVIQDARLLLQQTMNQYQTLEQDPKKQEQPI